MKKNLDQYGQSHLESLGECGQTLYSSHGKNLTDAFVHVERWEI